jgi:hypothetical protein
MTQPAPPAKSGTRFVPIKGRKVEVQQLLDVQLVLIAREGRLLQKDNIEGSRKFVAMSRILDVLESAVVSEDDREYLIELMTGRSLQLADLLPIVKVFGDEAPTNGPVRARRGRPPKRA